MILKACVTHDTYDSLSRHCINYQFVLESFNSGHLKKDHYHLVDARPTSVYTARIIAYEGLLIM
jgi:hypothetical protein